MSISTDLLGQTALVTGSSRGIGAAIAQTLAEAGCNLILHARSLKSLESLCEVLKKKHPQQTFLTFEADFQHPDRLESPLLSVLKSVTTLDILVNNAGILEDAVLGMISVEQTQKVFGVNFVSQLQVLQICARKMQNNRGGGRIVNISSIVGLKGNPGQVLYSAAKAAMATMTMSASKELAAKNILVNAIAPGIIETDMIRTIPEKSLLSLKSRIGLQRTGTPQDVANAVLYFCSPLSSYVTGQILAVDGGLMI